MTDSEKATIWQRLCAPVPQTAIEWRQDGKVIARDGKFFARFVCYIEAGTVRERLDAVVPGEWDLTLELLPQQADEDGAAQCSFKARIAILGAVRECVGTGRDYKAAATDAFKRAAARFGIGHELYLFEQNWVPVDGDGKYAKPLEDPGVCYARRHGAGKGAPNGNGVAHDAAPPAKAMPPVDGIQTDGRVAVIQCPTCNAGTMWDNRLSKRNPRAPDFKCRDRDCDGAIWNDRKKGGGGRRASEDREPVSIGAHVPGLDDDEPPFPGDDDLPF